MKTEIKQSVLRRSIRFAYLSLGLLMLISPKTSVAASATAIDRDVHIALETLYMNNPTAKKIAGIAKGILVFPDIIKGGFIIGGQYGNGGLLVDGKTKGYYQSVAASYGLQVGAQSFGYALFFLSDADLRYLEDSAGWEIGVGPTIVVMDQGLARSFTSTTAQSGVYAFFFDQKGLMAGLGIQGSKITEIYPDQ